MTTQNTTTTDTGFASDDSDIDIDIDIESNSNANANANAIHSHTHQPDAVPKKGILKRPNSVVGLADYSQEPEDNLMITEAQKTSTMKITEPKTPYIHYNINTDEISGHTGEVPPMVLNSALEYVAMNMQNTASSSSFMLTSDTDSIKSANSSTKGSTHFASTGDWDDDDENADGTAGMTPEEREKHLKFEKMRAEHYNMKYSLAEARKMMAEEDDDDEDDTGGNYDDDDESDEERDGEFGENGMHTSSKRGIPEVPAIPESFLQ
ncbi:hypothetical protein HK100_005361 [Physocladia obscura]|uniref:Uncharacterized protein n=1 Tax=Physocladia obscura TaxID=109957 RepID=A0AAD5TBR1_9FUNG|nr:hypothetical protein HK100_005361 [Physocladia obscura]